MRRLLTFSADDEFYVRHQVVVEHGRVSLAHRTLVRLPVGISGVCAPSQSHEVIVHPIRDTHGGGVESTRPCALQEGQRLEVVAQAERIGR